MQISIPDVEIMLPGGAPSDGGSVLAKYHSSLDNHGPSPQHRFAASRPTPSTAPGPATSPRASPRDTTRPSARAHGHAGPSPGRGAGAADGPRPGRRDGEPLLQ